MKKRISIRHEGGPHTTFVELNGPAADILIKIRSRLSPRQRRTIAMAFFRQIRPFLQYFRDAELHHSESRPLDLRRNEERGIKVFASSDFDSVQGKLGFEIRMKRLEKGWTLVELANQCDLNEFHLSRIERGHCFPRRSTLKKLKMVLGLELPALPRGKTQKVKIAQGVSVKREPGW